MTGGARLISAGVTSSGVTGAAGVIGTSGSVVGGGASISSFIVHLLHTPI